MRANFSLALSRSVTAAVLRVGRLLGNLPRWQWRTLRWRESSQDWLRAKRVATLPVGGWMAIALGRLAGGRVNALHGATAIGYTHLALEVLLGQRPPRRN